MSRGRRYLDKLNKIKEEKAGRARVAAFEKRLAQTVKERKAREAAAAAAKQNAKKPSPKKPSSPQKSSKKESARDFLYRKEREKYNRSTTKTIYRKGGTVSGSKHER